MKAMFGDKRRVMFKQAPLIEVTCQLRFPKILRIDAELPAKFQDSIRERFPLFDIKSPDLPPGLPPQVAEMMKVQGQKLYGFGSSGANAADAPWQVVLCSDFIAFKTHEYTRWADFKSWFADALQAFIDIYKPSFFSRTGLRYLDAIVPAYIGLDGVPWSELLQPYIAAELTQPQVAEAVKAIDRSVRFADEATGTQILFKHGLHSAKRDEDNQSHDAYLIDFDFFTAKRIEVRDAIQTLDHFNELSGRAFQWCIKERLFDALQPQEI
ncbi:MAG: TIGR04255 family protein [Phycisphaerales bacterium]